MRGRSKGKTRKTIVKRAIHILMRNFRFSELRLQLIENSDLPFVCFRIQLDVERHVDCNEYQERLLGHAFPLYDGWEVKFVGTCASAKWHTRTLNFFIQRASIFKVTKI